MAGEEAAWRLPHIPFFGFRLPCSPWGQAVNFLKQRDLWEGPCLSLKPLGFDGSRSGHLGTTYARNGHPVLQNLFTLIVQGSVVGWSDKGFVKESVSMYLTGKPRYTRMIYLLSTRKLGGRAATRAAASVEGGLHFSNPGFRLRNGGCLGRGFCRQYRGWTNLCALWTDR